MTLQNMFDAAVNSALLIVGVLFLHNSAPDNYYGIMGGAILGIYASAPYLLDMFTIRVEDFNKKIEDFNKKTKKEL